MPGTPDVAPLYPDPPIHYRSARMAVALLDGAAPDALLPAGLTPGPAAMSALVFADYPDTDIGPYREVIVFMAASVGDAAGLFCPLIYVDSDAAMAAGREVWGFPKKLADISLDISGGRVEAALARHGVLLAALEGQATDAADPGAGGMAALPVYNHKRIPDVAGGSDVDLITVVHLEATTRESYAGAATVETAGEVADVLGEGAEAALLLSIGDLVLPAGTVAYAAMPAVAAAAGGATPGRAAR